ncbi:MAG: cell division protein FtsZ [Deltaproteobacteria bacterium RBG_19FT_COMBO_52_11]|nr:MAG: cell division protein FtsZ [Deltaproteobacteria bacterium RBG_19FT_COMBO_52_11]
MKFEFVEKKEKYNAKIKVIGIGGGGCNAINNMIAANLMGVEFISTNTDSQNLERSACSNRLQLGPNVTRGLGSGGDPEIGKLAAEESLNDIRDVVSGADMVFITAGMGGGTGTGAAPVFAKICKESGALTVAVVTKPFLFEGEKRMKRALLGIDKLKKDVDTLIVIPNERLKSIGDKMAMFKDLITKADDVLLNAVRGISDLIISSGFINLDFADVKRVMSEMGTAIMGTGRAGGEKRASEAAQQAINSPLLEDISISGAKGLLMNITAPPNITMEEIDVASNYIKGEVSEDAEIFWGVVFREDMGDEVQVMVIATGIDKENYRKVVRLRDVTPEEASGKWTVKVNGHGLDELDVPAYQRKKLTEDELSEPVDEEEPVPSKKGFLRRTFFKNDLDYPTFLRAKAD